MNTHHRSSYQYIRLSYFLTTVATLLPLMLSGQTPSTKDVLVQVGTSVANATAPSAASSVSSATEQAHSLFGLIRQAIGHRGKQNPPSSESRTASSVVAVHANGDTVSLQIYIPTAHHVAIAGDMTEWHMVNMIQQQGGWWGATFSISSNVSRLHLRSDEGEWQPVPGLPETRDEYGGTVSLLVVPGSETKR